MSTTRGGSVWTSSTPERVGPVAPEDHAVTIRVDGLRFAYGGAEVLHGLTFEIRRGEVTGLLGPNGAGKSTLLRILVGILQARTGVVQVAGFSLPEQAFDLKGTLGYVPEAADVYEALCGQEFLEFCGRLHGIEEESLQARIEAVLDGFGLLDDRLQRLGAYSKGMRQKILISAALLHNPSLIVLDEPLTGLDADAAVLVKRLLATFAEQGKTVLYSSHVLDVVERVCARVLILDRGVLIADGSPDELKASTHERTLEDVFRQVTRSDDVAPRIARIMEGLTR
jgi:ABC-2 type transport system ATP-binding protein